MFPKEIETAFQRHPRPQAPALDKKASPKKLQVPTKAALLGRSLQRKKDTSTDDPFRFLNVQGELIQGRSRWHLCIHEGVMALVKSVDVDSGQRELEKTKNLSNHPHVATISQVFESEQLMFFRFEYTRFTLEEILNVHLCLDETHLRIIASSVCSKYSHMMIAR